MDMLKHVAVRQQSSPSKIVRLSILACCLNWSIYSGTLVPIYAKFWVTKSCSCWTDRIPFVLLFGIATSLDLFHERLSRAASRFLEGVQFDVEQTSSLLERIFEKAVAGPEAPLRLGSVFVSALVERQHDHIQSVQSFVTALKVSVERSP